jgi:hypothetical protein
MTRKEVHEYSIAARKRVEDVSRDELASRMTSMRQYDTGSCSESCEAFGGD